jgi:hypothetical protein
MTVKVWLATASCAAVALAGWAILSADQSLPLEPAHESGQSITGAFEGWFPNQDGTFSILVGYYNRNEHQVVDIPVGPNNKVEPGGPDHGQPTHFLTGRQWGVFTIVVPKDWGEKRYTWTITANGKSTQIPLDIDALWEVSPFIEATGNTPPYIGFTDKGPFINGPKGQLTSLTATVSNPLPLTVWVSDDVKNALASAGGSPALVAQTSAATAAALAAAGDSGAAGSTARGAAPPSGATSGDVAGDAAGGRAGGGRAGRGGRGGRGGSDTGGVSVTWCKFRGPGEVTFAAEKPALEKAEFKAPEGAVFTGKATTTATFSEPGEYLLKLTANDNSGEGGRGFQCCWSNAYVKVSVKAASGGGR